MRRAAWAAAVLAVCTAAGATAAPVSEVVLLSQGPSPFPEQGCGQQEVDASSPGRGTVELKGPERGQEIDLSVVVSPADPRNVVAAWVQDSGFGIVVASSFDGGRTFERSVVPRLTVCNGGSAERVLHARLAAAPDGTLYVAGETLKGFFPDLRSAVTTIPVSTSVDGGRSWSEPRFVPVPAALSGLDTVAAGPQGLVVAWHAPEPTAATFVSTSADHGATWSQSQVPTGSVDGLPSQRVVLDEDGAMHLLTVEATLRGFFAAEYEPTAAVLGDAGARLFSRTSRDGGATWSEAALVAEDVPGQWVGGVATAGGLVATWRGSGSEQCPAPLLSSSSPDARQWSTPVVVTCDAVGPAPSLAARPDGTLGISTGSSPENGLQQQVLHVSADGGRSWTARPLGEPVPATQFTGFYQETAAGPDAFYAVFTQGNSAEGERTDALLGVEREVPEPGCAQHPRAAAGERERPGPQTPPCVSRRPS